MGDDSTRTTSFGPLAVTFAAGVLHPRAWTLSQSTWAAELLAGLPPGPVLELCAGVGHIGLAAAVLAERDLVQVEVGPRAAELARSNAEANGWGARVEVRCGELEETIDEGERFVLVIADPPYLASDEVDQHPEDPVDAIDGGPDGLSIVRRCLRVAAAHLIAGGPLLLQVAGPEQAGLVGGLAEAEHLVPDELRVTDERRAVLLLRRC